MGALTGGLRYPQPNSLFGSSEGAKPRQDDRVLTPPSLRPRLDCPSPAGGGDMIADHLLLTQVLVWTLRVRSATRSLWYEPSAP